MPVGDQIRRGRKARQLNQDALAKQCGWPDGQSRISMYERGIRDPASRDVATIGRALDIPTWWFYADLEKVPNGASNVAEPGVQQVPRLYPVISWVAAGDWMEAVDHREPGDAEHWMPAPPNVRCGRHAFWVEVQGRSMVATSGQISYPPGSLILVDPDVREPVTGRLILARLDDTGEVTFKRLNHEGERIYLEPLNTQYPVIEITSEAQIVGTVCAFSGSVG